MSEDEKQSIVRQLETKCHVQGVATDLAIQAGAEQKQAELPKEYQEFAQLFSDEAADRFPPSREWDHTIDLKPGAPNAMDCKVYPMTRDEDASLEKFLDEMVGKGYIHPSKSPYASPFFFVKKKDGKLRPVQDYRWLNSHTVTVSPSPQPKEDENDKLHELRKYTHDFRRQHTTDAERFNWGSDDEDYGLAIGRLVVT
jgi:hypothetical protein